MWNEIATQIQQATGRSFRVQHQRSIGGGSVNQAYAIVDGAQAYFVKLNQASRLAMFEAEAIGLREIAATQTIRVPQAICWGLTDNSAYIVLEWLDFGNGTHSAWEAMGRNLAALHRTTSAKGFGWHQNNTIGFIPQHNHWTADWTEFFTTQRIGYQLELARKRGGRFSQGDRLLAAIPEILTNHSPQPSLVHGDLWSGNAAALQTEEPVIFDPATYYGDREVDLAMTELFGSFPPNFYRAYQQTWALDPGYDRRKILYNLYHILNHYNQFGGSYEAQGDRMMGMLLG